jgi:hypothetical protein
MTTTEAVKAHKTQSTDPEKAVKIYLRALKNSKRTGPGRPRTEAAIQSRIDKAKNTLKYAQENNHVILELETTQKLLDAQADMRDFKRGVAQDPSNFEDEFVKALPAFNKDREITAAAWRKVGVPALVLKRAGI